MLVHNSPYRRPSNDKSWLGLDTSPGTTLRARLFSRVRLREDDVEAVRRKDGWTMVESGHPFPLMNYSQLHTTDLTS
ncbi:hypothetical protein DPMN_164602 [Dreissena polymorpha]|uniref:Uncharacterized protein n=1 Tax=Dreissena polymorpha TaxID=45954 RepID=A0A9D4IVR4_DREPO|nr:hypothetical protein DPMN_164564 [Dreissena polymorpha]KAH3786495.1 hypothetical protein DPMN_164602 [Dreissena polymorpha]